MTPIEEARKVADAVLYEGYLLYPYRRSAQKNRARFQFGVLMPPGYEAVDPHERSASQTECLVECRADSEIRVLLRFLRLQSRTVRDAATGDRVDSLTVDGTEFTSWDEAVEHEQHAGAAIAELLGADAHVEFTAEPGETAGDLTDAAGRRVGRVVRGTAEVSGVIRLHAERIDGPYGTVRLRVRVENHTPTPGALAGRDDALRHAMIAAHTLIEVSGGAFVSATDPPEWAAAQAAACANIGTWPVLAGPPDCRTLMLSSPVILYDHPEIAPESAGDLFDATEIDEILTLRTIALTDEEKREARATDPRAADIIDRLDDLPPEMLERMHGAIRYLKAAPGKPPEKTPWWDPGSDTSVSPETDHVLVGGVPVARGSRVRMRPGARRADAQDLFLAGREATVQAVLHDVDGQVHVAVSPAEDPVADLQRNHGRFLYFAPDEIEPIREPEPDRPDRPDQKEETR